VYPITYGVLKPREVSAGCYRLARIQNSEAFFIFGGDLPPISGKQFDEYARSEVHAGDIVIAIGGYIGPLGIISDAHGCRLNINRHLARISPDSSVVDTHYLAVYLTTNVSQSLLRREVRGAVQAGINIADLKLHPVYLPQREIQRTIGDLVRAAEESASASRVTWLALNKSLESALALDKWKFRKRVGYTSSFGNLAVSRRCDAEHYFPAFEDLNRSLPSGVSLTPLSKHLTFCQRGKQPAYSGIGLPVINSKHVQPNRVLLEDNRLAAPNPNASLQIRYGDTLLNGTGRGTLGRAAPYLADGSAVPDNHVTILRSDDLDPVYLSLYLNSAAGQMQVEMHQRGTSGQLELYPFDIRKFLIWPAPESFQRELRELHDRAAAAERESKRLLEQAKQRVEQLIEEAAQS
jgi:restriction endonuclease S subunit